MERQQGLIKLISNLNNNDKLDLLLEIDNKNDERAIMREISLFVDNEALIRKYEYIPYMSITATKEKAMILYQVLKRKGFEDSGLDLRRYRNLQIIKDVDISRSVSLPETELVHGNESTFSEKRRRRLFKDLYSDDEQDSDKEKPSEVDMWNLRNIGAENLWSDGSDVNVAVIDTGADYHHIEIRERYNKSKLGYNFVEKTDDPRDGHGHGTHVSGTVAGQRVGVARGCNLYAVKVLNDEGSGTEADVIAGIEWCIKNDMKIVNMSLGSSAASKAEEKVCDEARKRGVLLVAAAGNNYAGPSYPAHFSSVMAVAAVDKNNVHAQFSNIHPENNISAPGVKIYSCIPSGSYGVYSGTSMASPHVAGSAVIRLGVEDDKVDELADLIEKTAEVLGSGYKEIDRPVYGAGLVKVDELEEH